MPAAFQYRPRFVDIRVHPERASDGDAAKGAGGNGRRPPPEPEAPPCEHAGCGLPAEARSPKGREHPEQFWNFCRTHAADYNKRFNWYAGLTEAEIARMKEDEVRTGGRPTWEFRASSRSREAAAKMADVEGGGWFDPFGVLGRRGRAKAEAAAAARERPLGRAETRAYEELDLPEHAPPEQARAAYAALVRKFHPDSNGGDRSAEQRLQRVIKAWRTLKDARLV